MNSPTDKQLLSFRSLFVPAPALLSCTARGWARAFSVSASVMNRTHVNYSVNQDGIAVVKLDTPNAKVKRTYVRKDGQVIHA